MTAVIYARYSSDSQREASIEGQLRDCKAYPCTVSKRSLLSVPRANMTRSAGCYEIRGQTGEECNKIFPHRKHPPKSPECQAFEGGKS